MKNMRIATWLWRFFFINYIFCSLEFIARERDKRLFKEMELVAMTKIDGYAKDMISKILSI